MVEKLFEATIACEIVPDDYTAIEVREDGDCIVTIRQDSMERCQFFSTETLIELMGHLTEAYHAKTGKSAVISFGDQPPLIVTQENLDELIGRNQELAKTIDKLRNMNNQAANIIESLQRSLKWHSEELRKQNELNKALKIVHKSLIEDELTGGPVELRMFATSLQPEDVHFAAPSKEVKEVV